MVPARRVERLGMSADDPERNQMADGMIPARRAEGLDISADDFGNNAEMIILRVSTCNYYE